MRALLRILLLSAVAGAGLFAYGCADSGEPHLVGETEGPYIDVNDLRYQVQISRVLNPSDPEDAAYLQALPEGTELEPGETWFGVFLRVANTTEGTAAQTAEEFEIVDTLGNQYEPVDLPEENQWAYEPTVLEPGEMVPAPDSAQSSGPTRGALLLFKLPFETLDNRPLEFEIHSPVDPDEVGTIALDV